MSQLVPLQDMLWVCEVNEGLGCRWQRVPLPAPTSLCASLTPCFQPRLVFEWAEPEDSDGAAAEEAESMWARGTLRILGNRGVARRAAAPAAAASVARMLSASLDGSHGLCQGLRDCPALSYWLLKAFSPAKTVTVECVCPRGAAL